MNPAGPGFDIPVAIVGAGACGLTAATALREAGIEGLLIERDAAPAGSTALSSGFIPAAGTRWQREAGVADSPEAFAADIQAKARGRAAPHLVRAYTEACAPALDLLARHGVEFELLDGFLYPGHHAPVMVWEDGRRVVKPMRYHCRPAGKPAFYDQKYPGLYNARRDNLQGFWKGQFGHTHGVVLVRRFYENVPRHQAEGRALAPGEVAQNTVLAFEPSPPQDLLLACLWSRWQGPGGESLLSFAVITDEPPPEVAATGHDRCPIPIQPAHIDAWLRPDPQRLADQQALLDDRPPMVFAHQLAA